jgi:hypothetical protein
MEVCMPENQQIRAGEAQCWACGVVVNKDAKTCPKCGARAPTFSTDKLRKIARIGLRMGIPAGIVSLIAGIVMFMKGLAGGLTQIMNFVTGPGVVIAGLLCGIGIVGMIIGPICHFELKKREWMMSRP